VSCSEPTCMKQIKQRGLCASHYYKVYRKEQKQFEEQLDVNDFWLFVKKELKIG